MASEVLEAAAGASEGFLYLIIQLVGYQSWEQHPQEEVISVDDVAAGVERANRNFSERVLEAICCDFSPNDLRFLQACCSMRMKPHSGYCQVLNRRG